MEHLIRRFRQPGPGNGLLDASFWTILAYLLLATHLTIVSVTLYLHRAQAHRALDLHPAVAHFFRFWLWLTTGIVTREWVAIHRKHHAKCETAEDPHSPVSKGFKHRAAEGRPSCTGPRPRTPRRSAKYGHGVPDDWMERHVYTRHSFLGVALLLVLLLTLFGAWGASMWADPDGVDPHPWAAGVINGLGHWWGYRNFESPDTGDQPDAAGLWIGGEELHNNHHTFPTSAKFSVRRYRVRHRLGLHPAAAGLRLARPRKLPPKVVEGEIQPADRRTLEALIANRYEVMAHFGRELRAACRAELQQLKAKGARHSEQWQQFKLAKRWLPRDSRAHPAGPRPAAGGGARGQPGAGTDGHDARGVACAVDAHQCVGRAIGG
jgi:stearoyl-CoA desaturase (delta-9 desaturase)